MYSYETAADSPNARPPKNLAQLRPGAVLATTAIFGISHACEGKAERKKGGELAKEFDKLRNQQGKARDLLNKTADRDIRVTLDQGHADYYPRFGFKPANRHGLRSPFPVPDEAFTAMALVRGGLDDISGVVRYPAAFSAQSTWLSSKMRCSGAWP